MQLKEDLQAGPPTGDQPRPAADDGPFRDNWLTKMRKSASQKIKNAIKEFVDYAKNSDL